MDRWNKKLRNITNSGIWTMFTMSLSSWMSQIFTINTMSIMSMNSTVTDMLSFPGEIDFMTYHKFQIAIKCSLIALKFSLSIKWLVQNDSTHPMEAFKILSTCKTYDRWLIVNLGNIKLEFFLILYYKNFIMIFL